MKYPVVGAVLVALIASSLTDACLAQNLPFRLPSLSGALNDLKRSAQQSQKPSNPPASAESSNASPASAPAREQPAAAGATTGDEATSAVSAAQPDSPRAKKTGRRAEQNAAIVDAGPPMPSSTRGEPGTFSSSANANSVQLIETSGEQLHLELKCLSSRGPCGRYDWPVRKCWGEYTGEWRKDGSLLVKETMPRRGECARNCQIVVDPGLGTYRRECGRAVISRGRFDTGLDLELLADKVDKSQFFHDVNAKAWADAIPVAKHTLEDDSSQYKAAFAAVPDAMKTAAATDKPFRATDVQLRDWLDAVVSVDARSWNFNTYIPGSIRDVQSSRNGTATVVDAKLTFSDFQRSGVWSEGTVSVELNDGKVGCIRYWNNRECSVSYATVTHPGADRTMTPADLKCMKPNVATKVEFEATCLRMDRLGACLQDGPTKEVRTDYVQLSNSCSRPITFVLACPLFRQRTTVAANSVLPVPGFSNGGCQMERVPE